MICAFLVHVLGVFDTEKAFVIIIRLLRKNSLTKLLVKRRGAGLEEQPEQLTCIPVLRCVMNGCPN